MTLEIGTQLGPYKITGTLGKGGMGEVYRAHDSRLQRDVAIKVSPERFSERFEREARAIAALNHPNICQIYDVGPNYLVMELVEGEAPKGPMDLDDALAIANQIADALQEAHSKHITHRDLKPGNIKITPEGKVKVLDFGLAKVGQAVPPDPLGEDSPTLTMGMTQAGMILGTAAYMSPEQARGKPVDERADIFAFGVVFYEILTGERLFKGEDLADTLASVVKVHPSLDAAPMQVRRLLDACLQKDPAKRLQSIGDMRHLIEAPRSEPAAVAPPPPKPSLLWPVIAGVAMVGAAALAFLHFRETPPEQAVIHVSLPMPENSVAGFLSLSPDGRRVLAANSSSSATALAVRNLDAAEWTPIESARGARTPFWSPDGRFIAFFAEGKLKTVSASGGPAKELCGETGLGTGGAWRSDGIILFGSDTGPMRRVSATGGACTPVMKDDPQRRTSFPEFLPDGVHYLYVGQITGNPASRGVYVASLDDTGAPPLSSKKVLDDYSSVLFSPPAHSAERGHLLFLRGSNIMAQPFDASALTNLGDPFLVAPRGSASYSPPQFAAGAGGGTLVYVGNLRAGGYQPTWLDRMGKRLSNVGPVGIDRGVTLSRDGLFATLVRTDEGLHLYDLARNSEVRFTADANPSPGAWSPDGSYVVFSATVDGVRGIYRKPANGGGKEELLLPSPTNSQIPADLSQTETLFFTEIDPKTGADIWYWPKPGDASSKPEKFLATAAIETQPQLSPDGRWLAYVSNETGQLQVYVRQFPSGQGFAKVSISVGREPRWKKDGSELYFLQSPDATNITLMAVPMKADGRGGISAGVPVELFQFKTLLFTPQQNAWSYAPSQDGQRFLVSVQAETAAPEIHVITNWLKAAKGAGKE
jgi:eukaryotic-like serine/threonine-protein kinase